MMAHRSGFLRSGSYHPKRRAVQRRRSRIPRNSYVLHERYRKASHQPVLVNDLSRWRKKPQREGGNVASRPDFESIKHLNPYKVEYWEASKPMPLLRYKTWHEFEGAIERAKISCEAMGNIVEDHFVAGYKMVKSGSGAERQVSDYSSTHLACYLIAMNGSPRLKQIAEAQHYFAVSTRKNEMHESLTRGQLTKKVTGHQDQLWMLMKLAHQRKQRLELTLLRSWFACLLDGTASFFLHDLRP